MASARESRRALYFLVMIHKKGMQTFELHEALVSVSYCAVPIKKLMQMIDSSCRD